MASGIRSRAGPVIFRNVLRRSGLRPLGDAAHRLLIASAGFQIIRAIRRWTSMYSALVRSEKSLVDSRSTALAPTWSLTSVPSSPATPALTAAGTTTRARGLRPWTFSSIGGISASNPWPDPKKRSKAASNSGISSGRDTVIALNA